MSDRKPSLPLAVGIGGALLGIGTGWLWVAVADHFVARCAAANAVNPESMCGFEVIFWAPAMVVIAAVVNCLVGWITLAAAEVRPRGGMVAAVPALTFLAALTCAGLGAGVWLAFIVPVVVLGGGMAGLCYLSEARRPDRSRPDLRPLPVDNDQSN
ncbi:hypothetical protein [Kutzneria buriramensis]|uniref:Uncharacterized protein n=1 Tax=Kutzneria buriramensis TaxID=1045776 RepID=A0A3E0H1N2_9PSEU|nr:hypothetical protein [Kutzneria buriramensis]REH36174.1 hypothetical protein BCF44_11643 [Kutzneria buriramensis]